jgi:hypothetical protein
VFEKKNRNQRTTASPTRLVLEKKNTQIQPADDSSYLKNLEELSGFTKELWFRLFEKMRTIVIYINPDICCERASGFLISAHPPPTLVMTYDIKAYELYTK